MKTYQAIRFHMIVLLIVGVVGLAACSGSAPISADRPSTTPSKSILPSVLTTEESDPLEVVNAFHAVINSDNVDAVLALFAEDATVTDNRWVSGGKEEIRTWASYSQGAVRLRLEMIHSQVAGEKVFWHDLAHNEPGAEYGFYILKWRAIIQRGKIKSLTVLFLPMPDGK